MVQCSVRLLVQFLLVKLKTEELISGFDCTQGRHVRARFRRVGRQELVVDEAEADGDRGERRPPPSRPRRRQSGWIWQKLVGQLGF